MRARWIAGLAAMLGQAGIASAQPVAGLYLGAGVGYGLLQDQSVQSPAVIPNSARFGGGLAALGSVGFGIGNGLRIELEGGWRSNAQSSAYSGNGRETKAGVMVNALFDFDAGLPWFYPYVGLGGGYQWSHWSGVTLAANAPSGPFGGLEASGTSGTPAYQAIIGAGVPIDAVPGLSVTVEYRFMALSGGRSYDAVASAAPGSTTAHSSDDANHAVLLGLRYAFTPPQTQGPAPRPNLVAPLDAPVPSRTYLVFFDWDSAALSARARDIIAEAVRNSPKVDRTRLEVTGHADRTGAAQYNLALSLRRARAVADEVRKWGVPEHSISVRAEGDTQPLVPTAAGVREPQNRVVEIVYR